MPETFRAIKPAGGWTKKALEKAARKIEIVQGWEVEQSGRYLIDELGNIHEKDDAKIIQPEVSQTSRDIEAHTGGESFERIAKREIAPIFSSVLSWDELHLEEQEAVFCTVMVERSQQIFRIWAEELS